MYDLYVYDVNYVYMIGKSAIQFGDVERRQLDAIAENEGLKSRTEVLRYLLGLYRDIEFQKSLDKREGDVGDIVQQFCKELKNQRR